MKKSLRFSAAIAIVLGSLLPRLASACNNILVQSMNGTSSAVNVGLTMNSAPADSLGLSLNGNGSHIDALPVGLSSPNPLHMSAHVTQGALSGDCSMSVTYEPVIQCTETGDPTYELHVTLTPGSTPVMPPDMPTCKHDNGNHIGEDLHKLGLVVGKDVPYHAGKLDSSGQPMCKESDKKASTTPSTPSTLATLSCQFVSVPGFVPAIQ